MSYTGKKLCGVVVPLVTPLRDRETLDADGMKRMIEYVITGGVNAIFILGSTGEGPALHWELRRETVKTTVELTAGRVPLLVNISCDSAEESIRFAGFCEKHGVDAVVASPPCYLPYQDDELIEFYRILTNRTNLPVYVYNMPELTKVSISLNALEQILELPGVAGVKDSSGDLEFFRALTEKFAGRKELSIFMGPDALTRQALALGADGGVNSGANFRPEIYSGLYRSMKAGNQIDADHFQKEILELQKIYQVRPGSPGVIRGLKRVLSEKGLIRNIPVFPGMPCLEERSMQEGF